jgi:carbon monoxide dehydrogenase subunit G
MIVDRTIAVAAPADETFRRVVDIPFVGGCLPGASGVRPNGDGEYVGSFAIKVGPVKVTLDGSVRIVDVDETQKSARLLLKGSDRRIGGEVTGEMHLSVAADGDTSSTLEVHTDLAISGKLGQFGQAVMIKKADQITETFVVEFSRRMTEDAALDTQLSAVAVGTPSEDAGPATHVSRTVTPDAASRVAVAQGGVLVRAAEDLARVEMVDPVPSLHALFGLLRRGRRFTLVESREALAGRGVTPEDDLVWLAAGAPAAGIRGADVGAREYVAQLRAGTSQDVAAGCGELTRAGLGRAAALALTPTGASVTDQSVLAQVCAEAARLSGLPVLVVGTTPWSLLPLARLAQTGVVHGLVADVGGAPADGVTAVMRLAIEEVRRAGFESPVIAGPARGAADEAAYRTAGADGVVWAGRSRSQKLRAATARLR